MNITGEVSRQASNDTCRSSADYLTVLTCTHPPDVVMTKLFQRLVDGRITKTPYGNGYLFNVERREINDIADLAEALIDLESQPRKHVIRGAPASYHRVYRRLMDKRNGNFAEDQHGHHWFMIDFDDIPLPLFLEHDDDAEILLGYLVRKLPPACWDASYYWQWSASHALDGGKTLRAHIFFWSERPHTDHQFENWAKWWNGACGEKIIDHVVLRTVQPNFTAAPIFLGLDDPLKIGRSGIHIGDRLTVNLDEMPSENYDQFVRQQENEENEALIELGLREPMPAIANDELYEYYLRRIGDGPNQNGFHEPMRQAIWWWSITHTDEFDEDFKYALRVVALAAPNNKLRDLETDYLSDYKLDASIKGARKAIKLKPTMTFQKKREQQTARFLRDFNPPIV